MKKISKQIIALLLAFVMVLPIGMFSVNPFATKARAEETQQDLQNNVEYKATNALGEVIKQAVDGEDAEESSGYFIETVTLDGVLAQATISAPDNTTLVVSVFDESSGVMVTSGKAEVGSDTKEIDVYLDDCVMPEFFVVKAFLLDDNNAPVCKNYEGLEYTESHQEFLSKTVYDFGESEIINVDYSYDNNFAVVSDEAVSAEQRGNINTLKTNDYENGIYVIENADQEIKSLKSGDVFYFEYGSDINDYILTKVGTIKIEGNTVTITASDDFEISDFFSYIKIDTTKPYNEDVLYTAADKDKYDFDQTVEHSLSVEKEYEGDKKVKASFSGELKLSFELKFYYDVKIFKEDYYEIINTTKVSFEGITEIKVEAEKELEPIVLFYGGVPIYPGLEAEVEVLLKITFSAAVSASGGIEFRLVRGTKKISGQKEQDISEEPSVVFKFKVEGEAKFTLTPSVSVGIKILKSAKVSLAVGCSFEISAKANLIDAEAGVNPSTGKKHACALCVDGDVYLSATCYIEITIGITKKNQKTLAKLNLITVKRKLNDFYISFISLSDGSISFLKFGLGECPNYKNAPKPHTHSLSDWTVTSKATCTKTGTRIKKCTSCGATVQKETISKKAHSTGSWITTAQPTCVKDGLRVKNCSVCKNTVSKEAIAKIGHNEGGWVTEKEPTCVENGSRSQWCMTCRAKTRTETLYALGHEASEWKILREATCTSTGLKEQRCITCGVKLKEAVIPAGCYTKRWEITSDPSTGEVVGTATCYHCGRYLETRNGLAIFTLDADESGYIFKLGLSELDGVVVIPAEFNNKPVVKISNKAFYCHSGIVGVVIPGSVDTIDDYAFWGCSNLKFAEIGNGVRVIGNRAFYDCYSLTSVSVPESVRIIEPLAFSECDKLSEIKVDVNNPQYSSDGFGVLFDKDKTKLIQYPAANSESGYTIPDSVITVVTGAFINSRNLNSVVLSSNLVTIEDYAFQECNNLKNITVPVSVKNIGDFAFDECYNLENVYYAGSATYWDMINIESYNGDLIYATIHYNYPSGSDVLYLAAANDYASELKAFKASANNTVIGNEYLLLVLKQSSGDIDLSNDNMYHIDQITASETSVHFDFVPKSDDFGTVVIIGDFGNGAETVFANEWIPQYTVKWIINDEVTETTVTYGEKITEPIDCEKEGYTFVGWDKTIPETMPAQDLTFTAVWCVNSYKTIWVVDGMRTESSVTYGEAVTAPDAPEKEGYTFTGWDKEVPPTMPAEDLIFTAVWSVNDYSVTWIVDGEETNETITYGEKITVPTAPEKEGYTFTGWNKEVPPTMPAEDLIFTAVWSVNDYSVTWIVDGEETNETITYGEKITVPTAPEKSGYTFVGWDKSIPETMPAEDLIITAVYKPSFVITVRTPSRNIVKYGDKIILHADLSEPLPNGWRIKWIADNGNFDYSVSVDGKTCTITPSKSGNTTFTVTVYDAEGNEISTDTQVMTSKAGLFDKIAAFFKGLFGMLKVYEQAINVMF